MKYWPFFHSDSHLGNNLGEWLIENNPCQGLIESICLITNNFLDNVLRLMKPFNESREETGFLFRVGHEGPRLAMSWPTGTNWRCKPRSSRPRATSQWPTHNLDRTLHLSLLSTICILFFSLIFLMFSLSCLTWLVVFPPSACKCGTARILYAGPVIHYISLLFLLFHLPSYQKYHYTCSTCHWDRWNKKIKETNRTSLLFERNASLFLLYLFSLSMNIIKFTLFFSDPPAMIKSWRAVVQIIFRVK